MPFAALLGALRDRFRLWQSPGARSAIQRQEDYLRDQNVTQRRWEKLDTPEGPVHSRVATSDPTPETVAALDDESLAGIRENAGIALRFVHAHLRGFDAPAWSLQELDDAFASWTADGDKAYWTPDAVEQIVGSAFGEHCVRTLGMRWVMITDAYGTAAAVEVDGQGEKYKSMRSFPFAAVGKRIEAGEVRFLVSIFRLLQDGLAR